MTDDSSDFHAEFRRSVERYAAEHGDSQRRRAVFDDPLGYAPRSWTVLAGQLGLTGLVISDADGGAGTGWVEAAIATEELGAALVPVPWLSTLIAAGALVGTGAAGAGLRKAVAAGERLVTLAQGEVRADREREGWALTGAAPYVLDGAAADVLLVVASTDTGTGLFAVDATTGGLTRTPLRTLDLLRRQARVELAQVPATALHEPGTELSDEGAWLDRLTALATLSVAAEQLGGIRQCLAMSVAHAKQRIAFGRPIGSFQAIKHKCADMLMHLETTRVAVENAARVADTGDAAELALAASVAKSIASDGYVSASADLIQILGGIGFTWEHDAHLYFRRARADEALYGDGIHHRARIASSLWGAA
jgi:alkylation response protein AidB-like acyl-CoA dehydrogenase